MKCIDKKIIIFILSAVSVMLLGGCSGVSYDMPYTVDGGFVTARYGVQESGVRAETFAENLCVVGGDVDRVTVDCSNAGAAALFDLKNHETLYAKAVHEKMYPASLTKVMTAIVAIENGSLDQMLTATEAVKITESGAAKTGLKTGDSMTLDQALHILLLASSNDVALLIADNVGGSVDEFLDMMNERARELGATHTHFTNPHGLTDIDHYTTAYDMYLIFQQAIKYDIFNQIINMTAYQTTYFDKNGKEIAFSCGTTNKYMNGQSAVPSNVTVLGGKTGTTNAAGHCLILHTKDIRGNSYISVVLRCLNSDTLYAEMTDLLEEINN